jgi:hypothetical protein
MPIPRHLCALVLILLTARWSLLARAAAIVCNWTGKTVYYSVSIGGGGPTSSYAQMDGPISVPFSSDGTSIKLATNASVLQPFSIQPAITQFEFTLSEEDGQVYYDISNQDGYPFVQDGLELRPSDPACHPVSCPAGSLNQTCPDAYTVRGELPSRTYACGGTDLELVLYLGHDE